MNDKTLADETIIIHATLDLVCSVDDGGWYFDDQDTAAPSIIYATKEHALAAYKNDAIEWV